MTARAGPTSLLIRHTRLLRVFAMVLTGSFALVGLAEYVALLVKMQPGGDLDLYGAALERWLAGGSLYPPAQVAGPYDIGTTAILYPPIAIPLLALGLILPRLLWFAIPIAILAAVIAWHRPRLWAWPVMAFGLCNATTVAVTFAGNPGLWVVAGLAIATIWRPMAVVVLLKPSLLPFALLGARDRGWWIGILILAVSALAFAPLWPDWIASILNGRGPRSGVFYSLGDVPLLAVPLVAWVAGSYTTKRTQSANSSTDTAAKAFTPSPK